MIQTTIRIPEELYDKIVKQAYKDRRSINSQFIVIIEKYFKIIKDL